MFAVTRLARNFHLSNNIRGILWALISTAMCAIAAAMAKLAVTEYHVLQILFFRQTIVFLSCLPATVKSFPCSLKTRHSVMPGDW
ncbi:MAG: hypothetical protein ACR2PT_16185 [Endozoicomonas sp.]